MGKAWEESMSKGPGIKQVARRIGGEERASAKLMVRGCGGHTQTLGLDPGGNDMLRLTLQKTTLASGWGAD